MLPPSLMVFIILSFHLFLQEKNFLLVGIAKQNGHWIIFLRRRYSKPVLLSKFFWQTRYSEEHFHFLKIQQLMVIAHFFQLLHKMRIGTRLNSIYQIQLALINTQLFIWIIETNQNKIFMIKGLSLHCCSIWGLTDLLRYKKQQTKQKRDPVIFEILKGFITWWLPPPSFPC